MGAATRIAKYESARSIFLQATEIDYGHSVAFVCLGKSLKRLAGETNVQEEKIRLYRAAIEAVSSAIRLNPIDDRTYYNRACYRALMGGSVSQIIDDLEKAIELCPSNRGFAKLDLDFEAVRDDASSNLS